MKIRGIEDSIFLHDKEGLHVRVRFSEILCITAWSNYSVFETYKGQFTLATTLSDVLAQVPYKSMLRISRSVSINVDHIEAVRGNNVMVNKKWYSVAKSIRSSIIIR